MILKKCINSDIILSMLVKKGQNINIINLHGKTVIYTSRFVYIHQDSYIYIKIRKYTSRFVYIHKDFYIYIKIRIYTSRFVYIHQDSYIYIKIRIYTSRFVYIQQDSYIYIKICICTLRFVQFGHKGKHDRWIDYRVFKRRSKNGSKWGSHLLFAWPCLQSHDRRNDSS